MKQKFFITVIFILINDSTFCQAPAWEWVRNSNASKISSKADGYGDEANFLASDTFGNIYVTGYYISSYIAFGNNTLYNQSSNISNNDIFLAKYDKDGNVIWARNIGGNGDDDPSSIAADANGNIFVAGYYQSPTLTFDSFMLTSSQTSGYSTAYIAKLQEVILGENDIEKNNSIYVFPNPCNGLLTVNDENFNKNTTLSIYNIFGEIIYNKKNIPSSEHIDSSAFAKGIYFVKIIKE